MIADVEARISYFNRQSTVDLLRILCDAEDITDREIVEIQFLIKIRNKIQYLKKKKQTEEEYQDFSRRYFFAELTPTEILSLGPDSLIEYTNLQCKYLQLDAGTLA